MSDMTLHSVRAVGRTKPWRSPWCLGRTNPTRLAAVLAKRTQQVPPRVLAERSHQKPADVFAERPTKYRQVSWPNEPTDAGRCLGRTNPTVYWPHGSRLFARKRALSRDTSLRGTFPLPKQRPRTRRLFGRTKPKGTVRCLGKTKPTGAVQRLARTKPTSTARCGRTNPTLYLPMRLGPFARNPRIKSWIKSRDQVP